MQYSTLERNINLRLGSRIPVCVDNEHLVQEPEQRPRAFCSKTNSTLHFLPIKKKVLKRLFLNELRVRRALSRLCPQRTQSQ